MRHWARARIETLRQRPFPCLVLHFFHRFFQSEMASGGQDNSLSIGAIFAMLAVPGLLLPLFLLDKYSTLLGYFRQIGPVNVYAAAVSDRYLFINFSVAVTGIVTVLKWDSLFPDRRDFANLAILPFSLTRILYAKVLALAILMAMFVLDLNAVSTIVFPVIVTAAEHEAGGFLGMVASHAVSVIVASFFTFFSLLACIGLLMNVLPWQWFRRISRYVRMLLTGCLLALLFSSFAAAPQLERYHSGSPLRWLPVVWFTGLGQQLMNRGGSPAMMALSGLAWRATLIAFLLAALFYIASYQRYFLRIPESLDLPAGSALRGRSRLLSLLDPIFFHDPFERACAHFTLKTLFRSEMHTLFLGAFMGLAFTFAGEALLERRSLEVPLILGFFLLTGLRAIFDLPAELRANWMFQVAGEAQERSTRGAVRKVMLLFSVTPLLVLGLPASIASFGTTKGCIHIAFVTLVFLVLTEILLLGYRKIPFTCARLPGKRNPAAAFSAFCAGFVLCVSVMADLDRWILAAPWRLLVVATIACLSYLAARTYWKQTAKPVLFEEETDPVVRTLRIA